MSTALQAPQATNWESREMVETLKQTVAKGATDAQFKMFIEVCKATGLNPFLKEIWFVPSVGVMAGRDGYLRVANDHPMFDGMETRVERNDNNVPIKAVCTVWRKDRNHPIVCEAFFNEYKKGGNVWQTYPSAMIAKVAEVLALKRSFSINGVVTEEEIGEQKAKAEESQAQVADRRIKELTPVKPDAGYEERHKALILEANEVLEQPPAEKPTRKRGDITYKALESFTAMKKMLKDASDGTDTLYYDCLKAAGVEHADELSTAKGKEVYKSMLAIQNRLKQDAALKLEVETHALRIGASRFSEVLGANGFEHLDDFMTNANGVQVNGVLKALKEAQ